MLIPNTAQIVDYIFGLLNLKLNSNKRTSIASRSEFMKQKEVFEEKYSLILEALSDENDDLQPYIDHYLAVLLNIMKEFNSSLTPLALDTSSKQKNQTLLISYWFIPFVIVVINKLDDKISKTSTLRTFKEWLIEILTNGEDTKIAMDSNSIDIEAFIRTKLFRLIPRGVSGDIKSKLASNKGWKSFSYNDDINKQLIDNIKSDLCTLDNDELMCEIRAIVKAGGILRKALKKCKFEELNLPDYEVIISKIDEILISPAQIDENYRTFKKTDSSKQFTEFFETLDTKLIKETNKVILREFEKLDEAIETLPKIATNHNLNSILLVLHKSMGELEPFEAALLDKTIEKAKNTEDDNVYRIIISKAHEQARQEFTEYIEKVEKFGASSDQIIQLSCIVLAISTVNLQTVQHNKMIKILAIIRRNLSSFGDFCDMPFFSTCFNRKSQGPIDYQRFNEDSQLFAYATRRYNQLIIQNLPEYLLNGRIITPLNQIDLELEEFLNSYDNGQFSKTETKKLTSLKRVWRIDQSSLYEALKDIDFYIKIFGVHIGEDKQIIPLSLDLFLKLSDERKKQALKALDPTRYDKDEAAAHRHLQASSSGATSYIGPDGLPVFIYKV